MAGGNDLQTARYSVGPDPVVVVVPVSGPLRQRQVTLHNPGPTPVYLSPASQMTSTSGALLVRPGDRLQLVMSSDARLYARSVTFQDADVEVSL